MSKKMIWTRIGTAVLAIVLAILTILTVRSCENKSEEKRVELPKAKEATINVSAIIQWSKEHQMWAFVDGSRPMFLLINPPREIRMSECKDCQFDARLLVKAPDILIYPRKAQVIHRYEINKILCDYCK